ncbi:twin-arginine translocase TatA/TatE family subunit [Pseudoclavibacter sp. AY1H1]|uniref:twin-arginine translocase TatA/TatE family subunit n=1 Tax=Pseudoclavibacter sp. AY1H1 TaxID=2080584 RepID=UPI000CE91833|nr:twin-arginine translocase TatA/TatE family subunit [Pseudoclavibacter sp. AY1H1]PPF35319.1 Sec-independent protein translocase TatA [Pseudoclavibacter sp. AY1H1]
MLANLTGWHGLAVLAIIVLIFGASKLPALAKSVGQSMRILKTEVRDLDTEATEAPPVTAPEVSTDGHLKGGTPSQPRGADPDQRFPDAASRSTASFK